QRARALRGARRPRPLAVSSRAVPGVVLDAPRHAVLAPASPGSAVLVDRVRQGRVELTLGRELDPAQESAVVEVRRGEGPWRPAGEVRPVPGRPAVLSVPRPQVPGRHEFRVACARRGVLSEACTAAGAVVLAPAPPASLGVVDEPAAGVVVLDLGRALDPAVEAPRVEVKRGDGRWEPVPGAAVPDPQRASAFEVARPVEPGAYAYRAAVTAAGASSATRTDRARVVVAPARLGALAVQDLPAEGRVRLTLGRAVDPAREALLVEVRRGRGAWEPVADLVRDPRDAAVLTAARPTAAGAHTYRASVRVAGACSDKPTDTAGRVLVAPRAAAWLKVRNPRAGEVEFLLHPCPAEGESPLFEVRRGEGPWRAVAPAPAPDAEDPSRFTAAAPAGAGRYTYRVALRASGATSAPVVAQTDFSVR
ncbi:hypothetical protein, partial [Kineococcus indalonis]|uniref:hypothetical protein n=1 Tax=Kineococcus indalonis TaxID=2696566 RepID=UPI0014130B8F